MKNLNHVQFTHIDGRLIITHAGKSMLFDDAPLEIMDLLCADLEKNPRARHSLEIMGIHNPTNQLRQYAICKFATNCNCSQADTCPFKGRLCIDRTNTQLINNKERRVISWLAHGVTIPLVAAMSNTSESNVRRIVAKVKAKYNIKTQTALGAWAVNTGL